MYFWDISSVDNDSLLYLWGMNICDNEGLLYFLDILSMARRFQKIAGKGGGVEYLILNFYSPWRYVEWNVPSIRDIISFRIYDLFSSWRQRSRRRGHATKRYARGLVFIFCDFLTDFSLLFSLCLSLLIFLFIEHLSHFFLALLIHLDKQGFLTRGPWGPELLTWVYRPKVKHLTLNSEWPLTKIKEWPWLLILTQLHKLI